MAFPLGFLLHFTFHVFQLHRHKQIRLRQKILFAAPGTFAKPHARRDIFLLFLVFLEYTRHRKNRVASLAFHDPIPWINHWGKPRCAVRLFCFLTRIIGAPLIRADSVLWRSSLAPTSPNKKRAGGTAQERDNDMRFTITHTVEFSFLPARNAFIPSRRRNQ